MSGVLTPESREEKFALCFERVLSLKFRDKIPVNLSLKPSPRLVKKEKLHPIIYNLLTLYRLSIILIYRSERVYLI